MLFGWHNVIKYQLTFSVLVAFYSLHMIVDTVHMYLYREAPLYMVEVKQITLRGRDVVQ